MPVESSPASHHLLKLEALQRSAQTEAISYATYLRLVSKSEYRQALEWVEQAEPFPLTNSEEGANKVEESRV